MASVSNGYDLTVTTYSQDGRLFQLEYAAKYAQSNALIAGYQCRDGVILAAEKWISSPLLTADSGKRVHRIADHAACVFTGLRSDAQSLIRHAITESIKFQSEWGRPIPGRILANEIGNLIHESAYSWSTRPYGVAILLATCDTTPDGSNIALAHPIPSNGEELMECEKKSNFTFWSIDAYGVVLKYKGLAVGNGENDANTMLEQLNSFDSEVNTVKPKIVDIIKAGHEQNSPLKEYKTEMLLLFANKIVVEQYDRDGKLIN